MTAQIYHARGTKIIRTPTAHLGEGARLKKQKLIHDHTSTVFEDHCRARFPESARYWEGDIELDLVAPDPDSAGQVLVAELK